MKTEVTIHSYTDGYHNIRVMRKLRNVELVNETAIQNNVSHSHIAWFTFRGETLRAFLQRYPDGTSRWSTQYNGRLNQNAKDSTLLRRARR